jgi:hypothetical protein
MPFKKGRSENPKGALNKTTMAAQQLLEGEAETMTRRVLELAGRRGIATVLVKPGKTEEEA